MPYALTIEERPTYLHAKVVGERTPENTLRFLQEVYAACLKTGRSSVLLEVAFTGPSLDTTSIYRVLNQRIPDGAVLRKIAYVQTVINDPAMPHFAETVARNRGVNVRLFHDVAAAERWLSVDND